MYVSHLIALKIFNFHIFLNWTLGLILRRLKFYTLTNHLSLLYSMILSNVGHISSQNTFVYQYSKLNLFELIFNSQMRNKSKKSHFIQRLKIFIHVLKLKHIWIQNIDTWKYLEDWNVQFSVKIFDIVCREHAFPLRLRTRQGGLAGGSEIKNQPACRTHGFDPWSGRIPHAMKQLNHCITTIKTVL